MENPTLDGPVPSPSAITPSPGLLNMNDFTLNISSPTPDTLLIPQSSAAKQPKKRKSWGQALPEPKTTLPPRKRAKTDDEKEQRRIERIKRNRAAAHNSRERKRVEAERLEVENHHLKHQLLMMQQHLLRQNAQLNEFQRLVPNTLPQLSAEEFVSMNLDFTTSEIKDERSVFTSTTCLSTTTDMTYSGADTPMSSNDTIDPRASLTASSPGDEGHTPFIKAESPCTSVIMPSTSAPAPGSLDQTRHSAAMLCDLQCRSSQTLASVWWAQMMLYLMHMNVMVCYKTLLAASWNLFPARMTRIMEMVSQSTTSSTTCSTKTSSRPTRTTRTTRRRMQTVPSATSTIPSSLLSYLSLLLQFQTSAQSSLAKGLQQGDASASKLALLSQLAEQRKVIVDGGLDGDDVSHFSQRRSWRSSEDEDGNGKHDDGGVG